MFVLPMRFKETGVEVKLQMINKTKYDKKIDWFKNHPIFSIIMIIVPVFITAVNFRQAIFSIVFNKKQETSIIKKQETPITEAPIVLMNKAIEINPLKKFVLYPDFNSLQITKNYKVPLNFTEDVSINNDTISILIYSVRFTWQGTNALLVLKLPDEQSEHIFSIKETPFTLHFISKELSCQFEVVSKTDSSVFIRTYREHISMNDLKGHT